jgi:hypothetical protein
VCVCVYVEWIRLAQKGEQNQFLVNTDNQPDAATKSVECLRDLSKYSLPKTNYAACISILILPESQTFSVTGRFPFNPLSILFKQLTVPRNAFAL